MSEEEQIIYKMLLIRRVEEEIVARYPKQLMRCPVHLSVGQEAIAVGVCHNLRKEDKVFSTHRCHAHYLAKGGSLEKMTLELHGKVGGCMDGRGGSMHLMDTDVNVMSIPIVGSAIPLAVGAALANKLDGNDNLVVCFFGDAAVEEGVLHESMNFASIMQLPIIFVCENNQYSIDTHISKRQPERLLSNWGSIHNIRKIPHYGHDVFAIADFMKQEIDGIRNGSGPIFVVFETERKYVHCGVEVENDLKVDPMGVVKGFYEGDISELIKTAFDTAESASLPTPDMASRFVYA
jgi:TPP-dependent pyruvate/acetoin dehydrogenase alpha subunit